MNRDVFLTEYTKYGECLKFLKDNGIQKIGIHFLGVNDHGSPQIPFYLSSLNCSVFLEKIVELFPVALCTFRNSKDFFS